MEFDTLITTINEIAATYRRNTGRHMRKLYIDADLYDYLKANLAPLGNRYRLMIYTMSGEVEILRDDD